MPTKATILRTLTIAAVAALAVQSAGAQGTQAPSGTSARTATGADTLDRARVLRAAADALGMVRWSDIGAGATRLPAIDVVNTMEFQASGTSYNAGQSFKTEYRVALGYNPAAMRVEMTRTGPNGGAPQHSIQTVRENYAWNESEVGGGLVPSKGTATPTMGLIGAGVNSLMAHRLYCAYAGVGIEASHFSSRIGAPGVRASGITPAQTSRA